MKQRLGIAAALLGDAPVLLFDEPVNGLDPEGIHWIRGLLRGLAGQGRAVFVSSHLMSELEDTADHLIVVARGRLVADISIAGLLARAPGDRVVLRTTRTAEAMAALTAGGATAALTGPETLTVTGLPGERRPHLIFVCGRGLPRRAQPARPPRQPALSRRERPAPARPHARRAPTEHPSRGLGVRRPRLRPASQTPNIVPAVGGVSFRRVGLGIRWRVSSKYLVIHIVENMSKSSSL